MQQTRKLIATALTVIGVASLPGLTSAVPASAKSGDTAHGSTAHRRNAARLRRQRRARRLRLRAVHERVRKQTRQREKIAESPLSASASESAAAAEQGRAATVAAALAAPCTETELRPDAGDLPQVRAAVLCLINHVRAEHSIAPLIDNPQLDAAAEGHAAELVAKDYFAHVAPDGTTPVERIRATGYIPGPEVGFVIGENLAWGTYALSTAQAIVSAWLASPGHLANILESRYRDTGIGVTPAVPPSLSGGAPGGTYAQEFGVIVH